VYMAFESWKGESWDPPDEEDEEEENHWEPEGPTAVWPFASEAPCDLTEKPEVRVEPFLFAADLVTPCVPGLRDVAGTLDPYWAERWQRGAERFECWQTRWPGVQPALERFGWELPTTWEFEWAVRGGVDGLFYWGDPPPLFKSPEQALA